MTLSSMTNKHLINKIRWIQTKARQGFWKEVRLPDNGTRAVSWMQRKYFHDKEALEVLDYHKYLEEAQRRGIV